MRLISAVLPHLLLISVILFASAAGASAYIGGSWGSDVIVSDPGRDSTLTLSSELLLKSSLRTDDYRLIAELSARADRVPHEGWDTLAEVERLYLTTYFPTFDLVIGKQQISWGTGHAWSPSDVFNPPDPLDPDGRRQGVTALLARIPHSPLSFSSLVIADDETSDSLSWGARYHGYVNGSDWSVFYAGKDGKPIIGGDIATDLVGLGVHSELTWQPEYASDQDGRLLWLAGADYSWLDGKLVWLGEYLYDSAEAPSKHSLFNQLSYAYSEFNSVSVNLLSNLVDNSHAATILHSAMLDSQWEWTVGLSSFVSDENSQYGDSPIDHMVQTGLEYSF